MSIAPPAFIASGIFIYSPKNHFRQSLFVIKPFNHACVSTVQKLTRLERPHITPNMRKRRVQRASSHPVAHKSLEKLRRNIAYLWRNANSAERLMIATTGIASVAVIGVALNVLFHISLLLAFSVVPFLVVPVVFVFLASLTAFAFLIFATAGVGALFMGTPLFAMAIAAKALLPVLLVTGATAIAVSRLLGFKHNEPTEDTFEPVDDVDDFEQFDRILRNRQTQKSVNVTSWSINDVVDELDYAGLGGYRQLFIEERIDGPALLDLTYEEIRAEFGKSMPLGDRMRLTRLVSVLKRRSNKL